MTAGPSGKIDLHPMDATGVPTHVFHAVAFVENLSLKDLAAAYPGAHRSPHQLAFRAEGGGDVYIYPFGAIVFRDVATPERETELARLGRARPGLTSATVIEDFSVREDPGGKPIVSAGALTLDRLTEERASVIALTVAQSAAMEYYERIVEEMFARTGRIVDRLEVRGSVPFRTRPLHRFIGTAISTRNEVLSVLHLLDKPDEAWDDPGMDRIYDELRAEFDLVDRYQAMEQKLRSVQEALELVLDVARDRRLVLLEGAIVLLIVFELVLSILRLH
ncbi:MAG TPA: RMD1 family protein [Polyangia bacterium]|nr:RMD1 family protein [Polyangia bacterium]